MTTIAVLNQSTTVSDEEIEAAIPDFQTQVDRDFAPAWGPGCQLLWVAEGDTIPADAWQIVVLDDSDQADALGYHDDSSPAGMPLAKVFARTTAADGGSWTVVFTHELLEMLADPWIDTTTFLDDGQGGGLLIAVEVGDPVEGDEFAYTVGNTLVTDFVLPAWFQPGSQGPWDHAGILPQSLYVAQGCYISVAPAELPQGWQQVFGDLSKGGTPKPASEVGDRS